MKISQRISSWFSGSTSIRLPGHSRGLPEDKLLRLVTEHRKWMFAWMPRSPVAILVGSSSDPLVAVISRKAVVACVVDANHDALHGLAEDLYLPLPIQAPPWRLPFRAGSLDVILLPDTSGVALEEALVVNEVQRVLRPNGKLIFSTHYKGLYARLRSTLRKENNSAIVSDGTYSEADFTRLLFRRFRVLRRHYGGMFPCPISRACPDMPFRRAANEFIATRFKLNPWRFFDVLADLDHDISWGRLSYRVTILAEKI